MENVDRHGRSSQDTLFYPLWIYGVQYSINVGFDGVLINDFTVCIILCLAPRLEP